MYTIKRLKDFEASMDRLQNSGVLTPSLMRKLNRTVAMLAQGQKLPASYRDHQLRGELRDRRECHIRDDVMLVYKLNKANLILILADIGGHSYLF